MSIQSQASPLPLRRILTIGAVALFVLFLYTFLHESGHALTGLLFGQSLTEFNVSFWDMRAHVDMTGPELSEAQRSVQCIAGAALPLLVWLIFFSLVPRQTNGILEILKLISSLFVVNTLLAWMIIPVLFLWGQAPADDVTNFLCHSGMAPMLLTLSAAVVYVGGWLFVLPKLDLSRDKFSLFLAAGPADRSPGAKTTIHVMAAIAAVCSLVAFTLNASAAGHLANRFTAPPDFFPVARVDLSGQDYSSHTLTEFSLAESTCVCVFISIEGIDTSYFDLRVTGSDGYQSTILHGEHYHAAQDGALWEEILPEGTYQVVLTSQQSPGSLSVYLKTH